MAPAFCQREAQKTVPSEALNNDRGNPIPRKRYIKHENIANYVSRHAVQQTAYTINGKKRQRTVHRNLILSTPVCIVAVHAANLASCINFTLYWRYKYL